MNKYVKLVESTKQQKEQLDEFFGLFKKKIPADVQAKLDPVFDDLTSQLDGVSGMPPMMKNAPDMARAMIQTAIDEIKKVADKDVSKQIIADLKKLIKKSYKSKVVKDGLSLVKEDTIAECLNPTAKRRADFNKKLKSNELQDLSDVVKRVKKLMGKEFGHSFDVSVKQAQKDVKKVNVDNLKDYMDLYEDTITEAKRKGKKDYAIYNNSYSEAVQEVMDYIVRNGYDIESEEFNEAVFNNISTGSKRPKAGKTTRVTLPLWKMVNGELKKQKKAAHFQVYGMDDAKGRYELNLYIS
jgi:hypothetical protein